MCIWLCTTVIHNTAQNSSDNIPSYPPDNHHCSEWCLLERREVSRNQKGKNHYGFYWSKRWRGGIGISWSICKSFAPRSRQITTPIPYHSVFLHTGCSSWRTTNSVKALKANPWTWTAHRHILVPKAFMVIFRVNQGWPTASLVLFLYLSGKELVQTTGTGILTVRKPFQSQISVSKHLRTTQNSVIIFHDIHFSNNGISVQITLICLLSSSEVSFHFLFISFLFRVGLHDLLESQKAAFQDNWRRFYYRPDTLLIASKQCRSTEGNY